MRKIQSKGSKPSVENTAHGMSLIIVRVGTDDENRDIDLADAFGKASSDGKTSGDIDGSRQIKPSTCSKVQRYKHSRKRDQDKDKGR